MKKLVLALLLVQTTFLCAATKPSSNLADYPLKVHVMASRYITAQPGIDGYQQLDTVIDGQRVELQSEGGSGQGVLALGDYKAQLSHTGFIPKHPPNGYDNFVVYRFLLPDGTIRDFDVIGLGPKADTGMAPAPTHP